MTSVNERRQEQRFVVGGMRAFVDGQHCAILDISATAVRLLKPDRGLAPGPDYALRFEVENGPRIATYVVGGRLIRATAVYFVLKYAPPTTDWQELIRSKDFMEVATTDKQLF